MTSLLYASRVLSLFMQESIAAAPHLPVQTCAIGTCAIGTGMGVVHNLVVFGKALI